MPNFNFLHFKADLFQVCVRNKVPKHDCISITSSYKVKLMTSVMHDCMAICLTASLWKKDETLWQCEAGADVWEYRVGEWVGKGRRAPWMGSRVGWGILEFLGPGGLTGRLECRLSGAPSFINLPQHPQSRYQPHFLPASISVLRPALSTVHCKKHHTLHQIRLREL